MRAEQVLYKALVLFSQVQALPRPSTRDISTLQEWLDRPEGGDFFLQGREAETWDCRDDVLTMSRCPVEQDVFSGFMNDMVVPWYHAFCSRWCKLWLPLSPMLADRELSMPCRRNHEERTRWGCGIIGTIR